jgi:hypothetical protein
MSDQMVRKQIYLPRRQNLALRRLAKERGVSEAEVIRQALEREADASVTVIKGNRDAWADILKFVHARRQSGAAVEWSRQELYEEREDRWFREGGE